jgi:tetratricopeptide (TPR) repeat protein
MLTIPAAQFEQADSAFVATSDADLFQLQLDLARGQLNSNPRKVKESLSSLINSRNVADISTTLKAEAHYLFAKAEFFLSHFADALQQLETARSLSTSAILIKHVDTLTADCLQQLEQYGEAIELVERTLDGLDEGIDAQVISELLNTRSLAELHLGRTAVALRDATRGCELAKLANAEASHGRLLCTIACIYLTMREWDNVLDFAQRSREMCEACKAQNTLAYALNMIGSAYLGKREFETARIYLSRSQQIFESLGNINGQVLTWNNLGVSHFNEREYERALPYYELSRSAARELGQPISEAIALAQIAYIHSIDPQLRSVALSEYNEALTVARSKGETRCEEYILSSLIELHEEMAMWETAYHYQKQLTELRVQIVKLHTSNEAAKLKRELETREKEHVAELHRVKAEALQEQLTEATNELSKFALRIIQQNEKIDLVHSQARSIFSLFPSKSAKPLLDAIASLKQDDSLYRGPEHQIESKHAQFIQRLSSNYPSLSNAELKVAALLKMGLNSKEIANILFTSHRTIETHRHHIRKKLAIDASTPLGDYLKTF